MTTDDALSPVIAVSVPCQGPMPISFM
ncbi:hypothetical protein SGPA1_21894 [Streptomyces misionensis JCM 4497]